MTGLRERLRDRNLPAHAGEASLCPPTERQVQDWADTALRLDTTFAIADVTWEYARWKPGTSITSSYRIEFTDGASEVVAFKKYLDGKHRLLADRDEPSSTDSARLRPRTILADEGAVLWTPLADRKLPGNAPLHDNRTLARWIERAGHVEPRSVRRRRTTRHALRYKPERRAVWRIDLKLRGAPDISVAARVLPVGYAARTAEARKRLADSIEDGVTTRLIAFDPRGVLLERWEAIEPSAPDSFEHTHPAGELLARLHRAPHSIAMRPTAAAGRSALLPLFDAASGLTGLQRRVDVPAKPSVYRWTHGDFHPDQVVRRTDRDGWCLLDLDAVGAGDPHLDLASWIADQLIEHPGSSFEVAADPLLAGYESAGAREVNRDLLRTVVADLLVHRAAACLRRLEFDAPMKAKRILERAVDLSARGTPRSTASPLTRASRALARRLEVDDAEASVGRTDLDSNDDLILEVDHRGTAHWFAFREGQLHDLDPLSDRRLPLAKHLATARQGEVEVLAYRPGKRIVVRERSEWGTCITKGLRASRAVRTALAVELGTRAARNAGFEVARLFSFDPTRSSISFAEIQGSPLAVRRSHQPEIEAIGQHLDVFQQSDVHGALPVHDADAELAVLEQWSQKAKRLLGTLPAQWSELHAQAVRMCEALPSATLGLAHRDLHDGQFLTTRTGVALLDFDLLSRADIALDVANLSAHFDLRALQEIDGASREAAGACRRSLLTAWRPTLDHELLERVHFYEGTTFLRLALVYAVRPRWQSIASALLDLAAEKLTGSSMEARP